MTPRVPTPRPLEFWRRAFDVVDDGHSESCVIKQQSRRYLFGLWLAMWPHSCSVCLGLGGAYTIARVAVPVPLDGQGGEIILPAFWPGVERWESCADCLLAGKCPKCKGAIGTAAVGCDTCNWIAVSTNHAPKPVDCASECLQPKGEQRE